MSVIITIAGSLLGLAAAIGSLLILNVGFLAALAIWSLSGVAATLLALSMAMAPAQQDAPLPAAKLV